jgi:hypothetical protein
MSSLVGRAGPNPKPDRLHKFLKLGSIAAWNVGVECIGRRTAAVYYLAGDRNNDRS